MILSPVGCGRESEALYKLIADKRVKTLVVGNIWGERIKTADFESSVRSFREAVQARPDLRVYVLLDYPWTPSKGNNQQGDYDPLRHVNRLHPNKEEDFILPYPKDDSWEKGNAAITRLLGDVTEIIVVAPYVCPDRKCNLLKWYKDDDHLQPLRLEKEAVWLDRIFEEAATR